MKTEVSGMTRPDDQKENQLPEASVAALRDVRWLTAAIWGALLIGLVVTSGYGVTAFAQGSLSSRYIGLPLSGDSEPSARVAAVVGILLSGVAAILIFSAWAAFAQATNRMVGSLGNSTDGPDDAPIALDWLVEQPESGVMSLAGGVVRFLGAAWAVMVVTPAVLGLTTAFG